MRSKILVDNPMPPPKLLRQSGGEPKSRGRPRKKPRPENTVIEKNTRKENASRDELAQAIVQTKRMRIYSCHDPKSWTDLSRILGKNSADRLVRLAQKLANSVTETSSKVRELKTYNEAINNSIHGNK